MGKNTRIDGISANFNKLSKYEKYEYVSKLINEDFGLSIELLDRALNDYEKLGYYIQVENQSKLNFLKQNQKYFEKLSKSNGTSTFKRSNLNIGIIADEFLYNSFKDIATLKYISMKDLEVDENLDFIIVASTWNGIDRSWKGVASPNSHKRDKLIKLINDYKNLGKRVVFYSKEDPVNYELFKDIAKECDVIFTSADEVKGKYIEYCNNNNVHTLQFGINPHYHNPIGTFNTMFEPKKDEVIFAGSWTEKYPERNKDFLDIVEGILESDIELTIIDRNLKLQLPRYQFPEKLIPNLAPPVSHQDLMDLHKIYRWAINVNSVKNSNSMFANRIFELQAFGNLLISNFSVGVNNQFPNVFIANSSKDSQMILTKYNETILRDIQAKSIRNVMRNNTTYHRLDEIFDCLDIPKIQKEPSILVLVDEMTTEVLKSFNRQLNVDCTIKSVDEKIDLNSFDFVTYMNSEIQYEEYYLEDLISAFNYTDVDFVTKNDEYNIHEYVDNYETKYKTMFKASAIGESNIPKTTKNGYCLNETEIFNDYFVKTKEPEFSVIVPIYNNGEYLEEKCFKSLLRSSVFEKMEIIFVDDGSDDKNTINIISRLRRRYPNIKHYAFEKGSGSASRPRNKGIELATTELITYLDPDNEAVGDGYAKLLESIKNNKDVDLVVGNILKEDAEGQKKFRYYWTAKKYNSNNDLITNTKDFMRNSGLRAQSIQAMIVRKNLLINNQIKMVEGAVGQDTLFFQEVVLAARKFLVIDEYIHVYYAAVTGSVTNSVSKTLFEKYMILEKVRLQFLIENNLIETYMNERFNFYVKFWYLPRLRKVKVDEKEDAINSFLEIYELYSEFERPVDAELNNEIESLIGELNDTNKL